MSLQTKIFITLATRDGARYLPDLLASLIGQTRDDWTLLVRDDGSTDRTVEILRAVAERDDRICLLKSGDGSPGSVVQNFSVLLQAAYADDADYILCCDQDDVWVSDKIERMVTQLSNIEGTERLPSLAHHDLMVVDQNLNPIADSYAEWMRLRPSDEKVPQRFLSRNEVTGCALACNRALLEIALPIPDAAIMHDWWLALYAAFFGRLRFVPDRLVQYRQHGANAIGAKSFWHGLDPFRSWPEVWRLGDDEFRATIRQASAFRSAIAERLASMPELQAAVESYCRLESATRPQRLGALWAQGLWRRHWLSNFILLMRMLLLPRTPRS